MKDRIRKRTKYLTLCAMLCALGVIILALGAFIEVLDISVAVIASLLCVYAVIEMGGGYPWLVYAVTAVLSVLLLPQKTPALFYALFAGYYPILKERIERLRRPLGLPIKLAIFHVALGAMVAVALLFFPGSLPIKEQLWYFAALYVLGVACFILYDIALSRLISFYLFRLRNRFRIK